MESTLKKARIYLDCIKDETPTMTANVMDYGVNDDDNDDDDDDVGHNDNDDDDDASLWWSLPEPVLIKIFSHLAPKDICSAGAACLSWYVAANDNRLWKQKFIEYYKLDKTLKLRPGAECWQSELKRLKWNIPFVQTQRIKGHSHQVLHVSFSHNGEMFATCSKDGCVIVWNSAHPCTERFSHNMKQFSWKYTQYSQFNQSDTLLLVSGVHFGSPQSTSGEIAVFTVDGNESTLRCRVLNRPYDVFGTWISDQYLISGDLHWLAHLIGTSVLWLNKANQEVDSEHVPIMNQLYKFYNRNASSVRAIMIARCPWLNDSNDPLKEENNIEDKQAEANPSNTNDVPRSSPAGNQLSLTASLRATQNNRSPSNNLSDIEQQPSTSDNRNRNYINYLDDYRREYRGSDNAQSPNSDDDGDSKIDDEEMEVDDMDNSTPKYLIFSTGSKTYTPHQIGIKRIRNINFPKKLDPGPSLKERIAARRAAAENVNPRNDPDWWDYDAVADRFDKVDKIIDLHGHIIGMALSPDHRYLYVNTRPWPKNYTVPNPLDPPPIAQEIDIHIIDMTTLKSVGNMLRSHKAYTPSNDCFFIFLDVSEDYVASGAEDMHAYMWDRYYGIGLACFKHDDVVNSVAFNPVDPEMLVTTSDDFTIRVWRSRCKAKQYDKGNEFYLEASEPKTKRRNF